MCGFRLSSVDTGMPVFLEMLVRLSPGLNDIDLDVRVLATAGATLGRVRVRRCLFRQTGVYHEIRASYHHGERDRREVARSTPTHHRGAIIQSARVRSVTLPASMQFLESAGGATAREIGGRRRDRQVGARAIGGRVRCGTRPAYKLDRAWPETHGIRIEAQHKLGPTLGDMAM